MMDPQNRVQNENTDNSARKIMDFFFRKWLQQISFISNSWKSLVLEMKIGQEPG